MLRKAKAVVKNTGYSRSNLHAAYGCCVFYDTLALLFMCLQYTRCLETEGRKSGEFEPLSAEFEQS